MTIRIVLASYLRSLAAVIVCLLPVLSLPARAEEARQVMLLYSFGKDFKPWSAYAAALPSELRQRSRWPLDITEYSLVSARSGDEAPEGPFVDYLHAVFANKPLDLIVAVGAPAAQFVQRNREKLFAATPMVFTAVEQRRLDYSSLTANDAVVAVRINYLAAFQNILQVLPDTRDVMVVVGASPLEKFWKNAIGEELKPLAERIRLTWTDDLSFDALLEKASTLPPHTAIFWELMIVDAAGGVHEGGAAMSRLRAVANAPIFSYDESFFGQDIVGGPLLLVADSTRQTAAVAARILEGERPGNIKIAPVEFASPVFDWRQMQRWGIGESRLPIGSRIFFRDPPLWSKYWWQLALVAAIILTEAALIASLLHERRRRRVAEAVSYRRMTELAHLNRVATAGELSASIAHEVKQPLAAMVAQSSAALRWLGQNSPDLDEARAALRKIALAGERASQIVENLRSMFRKENEIRRPVNINAVIRGVLLLTEREAREHDVIVLTTFSSAEPRTVGDQAQLEQVFINLVMNAIEALGQMTGTDRVLEIKTETSGDKVVVAVADNGPGIDGDSVDRIFDPFFTTKPKGMGMGLSICRSIVESHHGSLRAARRVRGMAFYVSLPCLSA
jgi:signal transduction histidine kinase